MVMNKAETILFVAFGRAGLLLVDITDFNNPTMIAKVYHPLQKYQLASSENVYLDKDEAFAFVAYRDVGVVVYDIRDPKNTAYYSVYLTLVEDIALSADNSFMVIAIRH